MLAAFGKHPGWDDHIDDIGLETARLVAFKRLLYFDGIAGNIDGGRWDLLSEPQRLSGFNHGFLHVAGGSVMVGRMWASRDGKGRSRYPMVVCAECRGISIPWAAEQVLGALAELESQCKAAETARQVTEAMTAMSRRLGDLAATAGADATRVPSWLMSDKVLDELAERMPPMENLQGFSRLIYKVERDLRAYLPRAPSSKTPPSPQHLRVPACGEEVDRSLILWLVMILRVLAPTTPIMVMRPVAAPWVDVLVGAPQTQHFYCMLASSEATPLITEIPYTLDPAIVAQARTMLGNGLASPEAMVSLLGTPAAGAAAPRGATGGSGLWGRITSALGGRA